MKDHEITRELIVPYMQAFQKGSPLARIVSKAILELSENGTIKELETKWLTPKKECWLTNGTNNETESMSLKSFWGIYVMSGATSTICFLLALIRQKKNNQPHLQANGGNQTLIKNTSPPDEIEIPVQTRDGT